MLSISVLILTYNEEVNIAQAIDNVVNWADEIIVLDSFSQDNTVAIAKEKGAKIYTNKFENYSKQRNHALQLPIESDWIFFLDADEFLTEELKTEIKEVLPSTDRDAFLIKRRFYWKGTWVKRGYYPTWLVRLGRKGYIECEDRPINEHMICTTDKVGQLKNDFVDNNNKSLKEWMIKHVNYADRETTQYFLEKNTKYNFFGSSFERRRWVKLKIWNNLPVVIRPFLYFIYRAIFCLGFMDGKKALQYHFLHAFIYHCLRDMLYLDKKWSGKK